MHTLQRLTSWHVSVADASLFYQAPILPGTLCKLAHPDCPFLRSFSRCIHGSWQVDPELEGRDGVLQGPGAHGPHIIHGCAAHQLCPALAEQLGQAQGLRPPLQQQHLRRSAPSVSHLPPPTVHPFLAHQPIGTLAAMAAVACAAATAYMHPIWGGAVAALCGLCIL